MHEFVFNNNLVFSCGDKVLFNCDINSQMAVTKEIKTDLSRTYILNNLELEDKRCIDVMKEFLHPTDD